MPNAETSAPTRVGDYALVRRIGAGGMGEVWLGRHVVSVRTRVAGELGMEATQVHLLPSGGHLPHIESAHEPESRARNVADIVRLIDSMLVTASVPSLAAASPSLIGPTAPAGSSTGF
jgi:hypothetical protein